MSANELRKAAETLRGRAAATDPHPWTHDDGVPGDVVIFDRDGKWTTNVASGRTYASGVVCHDHEKANGVYIATMHPGVGLALLGVIERAANLAEESEHDAAVVSDASMTNVEPKFPPLVRDLIGLARIINGGAA